MITGLSLMAPLWKKKVSLVSYLDSVLVARPATLSARDTQCRTSWPTRATLTTTPTHRAVGIWVSLLADTHTHTCLHVCTKMLVCREDFTCARTLFVDPLRVSTITGGGSEARMLPRPTISPVRVNLPPNQDVVRVDASSSLRCRVHIAVIFINKKRKKKSSPRLTELNPRGGWEKARRPPYFLRSVRLEPCDQCKSCFQEFVSTDKPTSFSGTNASEVTARENDVGNFVGGDAIGFECIFLPSRSTEVHRTFDLSRFEHDKTLIDEDEAHRETDSQTLRRLFLVLIPIFNLR